MVRKEELYAAVDDRESDIVEFLAEFVRIDTENPPGRNYREGAEFLGDALAARGYDVEYVDVPGRIVAEHYPDRTEHKRVNVIGRRGEVSDEGPNVHFTGHFDVVPAGEDWTFDPYDPIIEDGAMYGRGTSDMKSGIVASLFAIDALDATDVDLPGSITQSMTIDEETGGFTGLGYLVNEGYITSDNTDYCVYTECFDGSRVCLGHRGVLKFRVTATGKKAHGCMAQDGFNAISALNDLLTRMEAYRDRLHQRTTDEPVTPSESRRADVSATMIDAGYSENVIPDRATATFYRVLVPEESVAQARGEIEDLVSETEADFPETEVSYDEIMFAEPTIVAEDCRVSQTYLEYIGDFYDDPGFVVSPGSDDQRFLVNDAGISECIVYGPGLLAQAHVVDEHVPIDRVVTATKVIAVATADLLGVLG
ncbi:ArgE/DapE family deacylase [Halomarina halobia]|uniref:ArgE/DapE family deacylase n=1 Tax=Halomarina halobia TaxID=3033386 RepID=A0ABD6AF85_9EURY|nr:ArgE/DapE family deacylase [Halomarina sp. PSR21]